MLFLFTCMILWTTTFVHSQNVAQQAGIVGGSVAARGSWPFQASLMIDDSIGSNCGATVLDPLHVLTAAHCIYTQPSPVASSVTVVVRAYTVDPMDASAIKQTVNVSTNVWVHNQWNSTGNMDNDIAIILLNSPINFKSKFCNPKPCINVGPVTLPRKNSNPVYDNQMATAIGWGLTAGGGEGSPVLKQVRLKVVSALDCAVLALTGPTSSQVCAATNSTQSTCQGDSGGPLLIGNTQIGVVSFGLDKCLVKSVFTRVASYVDNGWIPSRLAQTKPSFDYCTLSKQNTLCQYQPYMVNTAIQMYNPSAPSTTDQTFIVNLINSIRQRVANGLATLGGNVQPSAANMMKISWNNALALSAQTWAQQANFSSYAPDSTTQMYSSVAQLIYLAKYQNSDDSQSVWNDAIASWYMSGSNINSDYINSYPSDLNVAGSIQGYTQLVWAQTVAVGCGAVSGSYPGGNPQNFIFYVCNFGPSGNIPDNPVYIQGSPGSSCPTGTKATNGLCQ